MYAPICAYTRVHSALRQLSILYYCALIEFLTHAPHVSRAFGKNLCHGLNVSPALLCRSHNPQCDSIWRRGHLGDNYIRRSQEGRIPVMV